MKPEPFRCADGLIRWPVTYVKKEKKTRVEESIPQEAEEFEKLFRSLSLQFMGEELYFCRKGWTRKKLLHILSILENLANHKVDLQLYLLFAFERARKFPRMLWPAQLASLNTIKKFQTWLSSFASKKEARRPLRTQSLEEILEHNHKKYLYYREKIGFSDDIIVRMKAAEFDPFYLLTTPAFSETYEHHPEALGSIRTQCDAALETLQKSSSSAKEFWELVRRVKCQHQETHSTSYSREKSSHYS